MNRSHGSNLFFVILTYWLELWFLQLIKRRGLGWGPHFLTASYSYLSNDYFLSWYARQICWRSEFRPPFYLTRWWMVSRPPSRAWDPVSPLLDWLDSICPRRGKGSDYEQINRVFGQNNLPESSQTGERVRGERNGYLWKHFKAELLCIVTRCVTLI